MQAGDTPLHYAAGMGLKDITEVLLAQGADHTIRNRVRKLDWWLLIFNPSSLTRMDLIYKGWPSQQSKNKVIAKDLSVRMSNAQLCDLGVTYPSLHVNNLLNVRSMGTHW
jgi:ankyrin repeat protein